MGSRRRVSRQRLEHLAEGDVQLGDARVRRAQQQLRVAYTQLENAARHVTCAKLRADARHAVLHVDILRVRLADAVADEAPRALKRLERSLQVAPLALHVAKASIAHANRPMCRREMFNFKLFGFQVLQYRCIIYNFAAVRQLIILFFFTNILNKKIHWIPS